MFPLVLALALTAQAGTESDPNEVVVQGGVVFVPDATLHTLSARLVAEKDAYVGVETRLAGNGRLVGRAGAGFDVFGGGDLDLKLGLWLGSLGTWDELALHTTPTIGTEVAFGVTWDRLYAQHRWIVGMGRSPADRVLSEGETLVGFRVVDEFRLYGTWTNFDPQGCCDRNAVGVGLAYAF